MSAVSAAIESLEEESTDDADLCPVQDFVVEFRDPRDLFEHDMQSELFGAVVAHDVAQDLECSMRGGWRGLLTICGANCASEENTILDGHRRWQMAIKLGLTRIPCRILSNLSANEEVFEVVDSNRAHLGTRILTEEQTYKIEKLMADMDLRRPGRPGAGSAPPKGKKVDAIAERFGVTATAVRDRKKIFESPFASMDLRAAVNSRAVARSKAAFFIRRVESRTDLNDDQKRRFLDQLLNPPTEHDEGNEPVTTTTAVSATAGSVAPTRFKHAAEEQREPFRHGIAEPPAQPVVLQVPAADLDQLPASGQNEEAAIAPPRSGVADEDATVTLLAAAAKFQAEIDFFVDTAGDEVFMPLELELEALSAAILSLRRAANGTVEAAEGNRGDDESADDTDEQDEALLDADESE